MFDLLHLAEQIKLEVYKFLEMPKKFCLKAKQKKCVSFLSDKKNTKYLDYIFIDPSIPYISLKIANYNLKKKYFHTHFKQEVKFFFSF